MAQYYFHLRNGTDELLDDEGRELPDLDALKKAVLDGARDVMGGDLKSGGVVDLRYRIDAEDEGGTVVYSLPFRDAVNIIPQ